MGYTVERSSVDFNNYGGEFRTRVAEVYIKTLDGYYWGLCEGYSIKEIEEIEIGDWVYYKSGEIKKLTEITQANLDHYRKLRSAVIIRDEDLLKHLNNL